MRRVVIRQPTAEYIAQEEKRYAVQAKNFENRYVRACVINALNVEFQKKTPAKHPEIARGKDARARAFPVPVLNRASLT